ncbi:MAG: hypothetical protein IJY25_02735 [Bacilli bacterium]|nr:hypothetical protein [Bacilli bacterium]
MKKIINRIKVAIKNSSKASLWTYIILRILTIFCLVRELFNGNYENALLCILSLILFLLPAFIERKFKIDFPTVLEVIVYLFIFSAEILGEINNFYGAFSNFDNILHTLNGFLCASIGFSLIYLLNENIESFKLSPLFVSIVAFCFSMTIGVAWEFFEYGMDNIFGLDMQKDEYVYNINTVTIDPKFDNNVISINDINQTVLYDSNNNQILNLNGYLDIGLHDTMKDLIVNFIGALIFSVFGYLYILNDKKYNIAGKFLTKRKNS